MWPHSPLLGEILRTGGRLATEVTATPPGGDPVELVVDACEVKKSLAIGARFTASLTVVGGGGVEDLLTTPGVRVAVDAGAFVGPGRRELLPMGRYEVSHAPERARDGAVSVDLIDSWQRLEETRFVRPWSTSAGSRQVALWEVVSDAIPDVSFMGLPEGSPTGGRPTRDVEWDRDRTEAVTDLARDGGLQAFFAADGTFTLLPSPEIGQPVYVFTDHDGASADWLTVELDYERLYNAVVVISSRQAEEDAEGGGGGEDPAWPVEQAPVIHIADTDHPRHRSKIGVRPFFWATPTIANRGDATWEGIRRLPRVAQPMLRAKGDVFGTPWLEPGDTVRMVLQARDDYSAFDERFLIEETTYDCVTGTGSFTARASDDEIETEEAT